MIPIIDKIIVIVHAHCLRLHNPWAIHVASGTNALGRVVVIVVGEFILEP